MSGDKSLKRAALVEAWLSGPVADQYAEIDTTYRSYASAHEAHAVLLEEVDELWDEVKLKRGDDARKLEELKDIAVVVMRWAGDLLEAGGIDDPTIRDIIAKVTVNGVMREEA